MSTPLYQQQASGFASPGRTQSVCPLTMIQRCVCALNYLALNFLVAFGKVWSRIYLICSNWTNESEYDWWWRVSNHACKHTLHFRRLHVHNAYTFYFLQVSEKNGSSQQSNAIHHICAMKHNQSKSQEELRLEKATGSSISNQFPIYRYTSFTKFIKIRKWRSSSNVY